MLTSRRRPSRPINGTRGWSSTASVSEMTPAEKRRCVAAWFFEYLGRQAKRRRTGVQRARRRFRAGHRHVTNLVLNGHRAWQAFLARAGSVVFWPEYGISKMVRKYARVFGSSTARRGLLWSPYALKQRLLFAAVKYRWLRVVVVSERQTTMACAVCGALNRHVGGSREYHCINRACRAFDIAVSRDGHSAINVYLWHGEPIITLSRTG